MERGPTIVRDHPVERVPITDRDPGPIPWWHAVGRDPGVDVTENGVPDEIMTFMTDSSSVAYYRFHGFATDKEAFVALSAASIAWAKSVDPEMWKR